MFTHQPLEGQERKHGEGEDGDQAGTSRHPTPVHNLHLPLLRERMQKFILYETRARFYLVGSNMKQDTFRVLKIDRTNNLELNVEVYDHIEDL